MEDRNAFKLLAGKRTRKRPLGRLRRRRKDDIRMDFKEICVKKSSWINSTFDLE